MATVNEIKPNVLTLEFRQEKDDPDYGSCLWARFSFNLDRYELLITSDCGSYGYKWCETPNSESFLELMTRVSDGYLLQKLYGNPDIFDYERTKESAYRWYGEDEDDRKKLDEIFEAIEDEYEPNEGSDFLRMFDDQNHSDDYRCAYFSDTFELPQYSYPKDAEKICAVFRDHIQPAIRERIKK